MHLEMDIGTICKHNLVINYEYVDSILQLIILLIMPRLNTSMINSPCPSTATFHQIFIYLCFQKSDSIEATT